MKNSSKDKQIEEMVKDLGTAPTGIVKEDFTIGTMAEKFNDGFIRTIAAHLVSQGYRKASEVALEVVDDFQRTIRHIFLDMCNGNDYNTLNLLQIDSAIEALFDCKIAELKKKYTESEKDDDNT